MEGEGIVAMQYLRSLVPEWLWSAQDFPYLPHPTPHPASAALSSEGSVFPPAELYLGFLRPNLMAFLPLPTPTESQVAAGLRIPQVPTLCAQNATVMR